MIDTGKFDFIRQVLEKRILVLDGAMGSLVQCHCGNDGHEHTHDHAEEQRLPDLLVRENPALIKDIHLQYLEAGADIIETNSFNSNRFSLSDYGLEAEAYNLSKEAAELARQAVEEYKKQHSDAIRFVAGSVGPTKHMLSLAADDPILNFDSFADAYKEQIEGLLDGGADIILLETVFDTLTVKAALYAVSVLEEERGEKIPVMVSATVANSSGRLLGGQSIEAFYASVAHGDLLSVGLNCGFGSGDVLSYIERLSEVAETAVSVYPNAGLPDDCGEYTEDAETFAENLEECLEKGLVNIIGGCCGTTPPHIRAIKRLAERYVPRIIPERRHSLMLSNMDLSCPGDSKELIQIGERTNVAGSAKFARLIREKKFDEALEVAVKQVEVGARVIDICMDDGLEDSVGNMRNFIAMVNSNPETGRVPVMIDSSNWDVISSALRVNQGKGVVNSISLKEGEEEFLKRAREIRRLGAAAVVMLFDEEGQAETFSHKIRVAERAYRLLVEDGFNPEDIIFDPNVLTVGSGLKDEDLTAVDFIKATRWIKDNLPYASVSGGISNLSFAFRGNNPLREAMHTVFLYHASKAGLDMAIVNAGMLMLHEDIEPQLLELLDDLILCRRGDAVARLIEYASTAREKTPDDSKGLTPASEAKELTLEQKVEQSLIKGLDKNLEDLIEEALKERTPLEIIDGMLMPAMKRIGEKFGEGRMFLPQVIRSAQAMKKAVALIEPFMNKEKEAGERIVLIATVKGDVHDIGKNIVGLVASCNGFEVKDLGVRVESNVIADQAEIHKPEAILLSGLISPSLNEMVKVCRELERRGLRIPVVIGGAATSELHTAVKIAPEYSGSVYYSPDAAENLRIISNLSEDKDRENRKRQEELRKIFIARRDGKKSEKNTATVKSGEKKRRKDASEVKHAMKPGKEVWLDFPIEKVEEFIDWEWLLKALDLGKSVNSDRKESEKAANEVLKEVDALFEKIKKEHLLHLEGVAEIFETETFGDDIVLKRNGREVGRLPSLRAEKGRDVGRSVVDFLAEKKDYVALFAVTGGIGLDTLYNDYEKKGEPYRAFLVKLIADRLAEAFAQWVSRHLAVETWGFSEKESVRIAFGYPASPDHTLKKDTFRLLDIEKLTHMKLTENSMIIPGESVCGMILSSGEYINVGKIGKKQLSEYARRRGITPEHLATLIPNNIEE